MKKFIINAMRDGKPVNEEVEGTRDYISHIYTPEFGYTNVDIKEVRVEDTKEPVITKPTGGLNIPSDKEIMEMALAQNNTDSGVIRGSVPLRPETQFTSSNAYNGPSPKYKEYMVGDTKIRVNLSNGVLEEYTWVNVDPTEGTIGFKREGEENVTAYIEGYEVYRREWVEQSTNEEDA